MAGAITMQGLIDASLDSESLETLVNGDENTDVNTRLGEFYPSAKKAVKLLIEQGTIDATVFSSKATMQSSALADDSYALVTSDLTQKNNGYYQKKSGVWVYLEYNPMNYTDKIDALRVSADSAQIIASADLLEPASENLQFEMKDGDKQILRVEDDGIYGTFYTEDGQLIIGSDGNEVRSVYDLYSPSESISSDLGLYDGDNLVANLADNQSQNNDGVSAIESLFYNENDQLFYADSISNYLVDTVATPINTAPFTSKSCLAVTDNQWFKDGRSVVTMGANGCQYPNPNKVLVVVPTYGQSLSVGAQGVPPISTNNPQPAHALMFDGVNARLDSSGTLGRTPLTDFAKAIGFEPIVVKNNTSNADDELSKEMLHIPFAQKVANVLAVENDAPIRILSFAAGVGGTPLDLDDFPQYEQEGLGLKKGSNAYANLINAISKAKELAAVKGWSVVVPCILWQHGEADASNANYALRLNTLISDVNADIKAITAQTQNVMFYAMLKANHNGGATVGIEQMQLVDTDNSLFTIIGSTYPAEPALWASDYTHRSARGYNYMGYMYAKAFYHELKRGFGNFKGLTFQSATIAEKIINVQLNVPVAPIKYKTNDVVLADPTWGFKVSQNGVDLAITSVAISSANTVSITLVNTPSAGNLTIKCAMQGHSGTPTLQTIPRSNVCDSDNSFGESAGNDGTENWLIPFTTTITV